jgi:hypothetical protein
MERELTEDERLGMEWWNGLNESDRRYWLQISGSTGCPADAWDAYVQAGMPAAEMSNIELTASLTDGEAMALAQLMKRIGFSYVRSKSVDDEEANLMLQACEKVRGGLSVAGYNPR